MIQGGHKIESLDCMAVEEFVEYSCLSISAPSVMRSFVVLFQAALFFEVYKGISYLSFNLLFIRIVRSGYYYRL